MSKKIQRNNWVSRFELVGRPKVNEYTFKINSKSEKSAWTYNAMSLYMDCGEKYGDILCEMIGGYNAEGKNFIYAHGKDEKGKDDFSEESKIEVAWEDRHNKKILDNIGDLCFINVGIEKDVEGKTFYKKFLSEYDAIAYIKEHINENMILRVKGDLNYSLYNDNVVVRKRIKSIVLSSKITDAKDFSATFAQSILLDRDSASMKNLDKATGELPIYAKVLDYVKEIDGTEIKTFYPIPKVFHYKFDLEKQQSCEYFFNTYLKVKKGITQVNFKGELIENGTVTISFDELPDEIKELINIGAYTKEEALSKCTENKSKDKKMYITKPDFIMEGDEGSKQPKIMKFENAYTEEDLIFEIAQAEENDTEVSESNVTSQSSSSDMDWLKNLC